MIKRLGDKTKNIGIKKIMKKNQVVILALALMLMTAGYLNYTNNHENENLLLAGLGDAQLVSANVTDGSVNEDYLSSNIVDTNNVDQSETTENNSNEQNVLNEDIGTNENNIDPNAPIVNSTNGQTQETSTSASNDDYFTRSKLERETMYSQMLETYENVLNSSNSLETQKQSATDEIKKINDTKNSIMICENLIQTKGFENNVIFVNGDSISVVIRSDEMSQEEVAQVQNIISREMKAEIENIHISTK